MDRVTDDEGNIYNFLYSIFNFLIGIYRNGYHRPSPDLKQCAAVKSGTGSRPHMEDIIMSKVKMENIHGKFYSCAIPELGATTKKGYAEVKEWAFQNMIMTKRNKKRAKKRH